MKSSILGHPINFVDHRTLIRGIKSTPIGFGMFRLDEAERSAPAWAASEIRCSVAGNCQAFFAGPLGFHIACTTGLDLPRIGQTQDLRCQRENSPQPVYLPIPTA